MTKKNKLHLLFSFFTLLLPLIVGWILYGLDLLPEEIGTHWGADGAVDGHTSSLLAITVLPLILTALHAACVFFTLWDKKRNGQNEKIVHICFWICPTISLVTHGIIYANVLDYKGSFATLLLPLFGILFLILGNYMPKTKRNKYFGLKLYWTLSSDENWNRTHRFAGRLMVVVGLLCFPAAFLPQMYFLSVFVPLLLAIVILPIVYSYRFYRKQKREGTLTWDEAFLKKTKGDKIAAAVALVLGPIILVGCGIICFTGNLSVTFNETAFTVDATYWESLTVEYDSIDAVEYRESGTDGERVSGFGSPRLSLGRFHNEEFGNYARYTYTQVSPCIVLKADGNVLILNLSDEEKTKMLYNTLLDRTGETK